MRWVASDAIFKASIDWLRLPFSAQATHDTLERHCGRQENWGIIRDCRDWKNSWWAAIGISRQRIRRLVELGLCRWVTAGPHSPEAPPTATPSPEGRDLEVLHYDREGQLKSYRGSRLQSLRAQIRWQNETSALSKRLILSETPDRTRSPRELGSASDFDPNSAFQAELGDAAASAAASAAGHAKRSAPHRSSIRGSAAPAAGPPAPAPAPPKTSAAKTTTTTRGESAGRGGGGGAADASRMAEFEAAYPRDVDDTADFERAWRELGIETADELAALVAKAAQYRRSGEALRDGGRYIKKPQTWLRQRAIPWLAKYRAEVERTRKAKESNGTVKVTAALDESEKTRIRATWGAAKGQA